MDGSPAGQAGGDGAQPVARDAASSRSDRGSGSLASLLGWADRAGERRAGGRRRGASDVPGAARRSRAPLDRAADRKGRAHPFPARHLGHPRAPTDRGHGQDQTLPRSDHRRARADGRDAVLDAERIPPPHRHERARREDHPGLARARADRGLSDPRAQHREGPQPPREGHRRAAHVSRSRRARRWAPRRGGLRARIRRARAGHAGLRLRGAEAPVRRRLPPYPAQGRWLAAGASAGCAAGAQGARAAPAGVRRGRQHSRRGAQATRSWWRAAVHWARAVRGARAVRPARAKPSTLVLRTPAIRWRRPAYGRRSRRISPLFPELHRAPTVAHLP